MTKTLKTTLSAVALVAALSIGGYASAQAGEAPSKTVSYADLDITSQDGAKELYARIHNAADEICRNIYPPYNPAGAIDRYRCTRELTAQSVRDVKVPAFAALIKGHNLEVAANR